ncbi:hypothetical protein D3C71_1652530 [compost metagenome]
MAAHQRGQQLLFLPRETGDVRVLQHVAAMHVVAAVRDHQAELVQPRGPAEHAGIVRIQLPAFFDLGEQVHRRAFHAISLDGVDAVTLGQCRDRFVAQVVLAGTAEDVVENAFAHRRLADQQLLQPKCLEGGFEHQDATGDDRATIRGEAGQVDILDALGLEQLIA